MVDSNLVSLIDLKDTLQLLDIYSNKIIYIIYEFFYIINQYQPNNILFEILFKIVYFSQFFFISITWIPLKVVQIDKLINMMNNIKSHIYYHDMIKNKFQYIFSLIGCFIFIIIIIIFIIIIIKNKNNPNQQLIKLFNYINLFYINYFFIFHINAMLSVTYCKDSIVKFIELDCYSIKHILLIIVCFIFLFISIFYLFLLTRYTGTIGNMKSMNIYSKINSNYHFYSNIFCILCNIIGFYVFVYGRDNIWLRLLGRINIIIDCLIMLFYYLKKVYFYNEVMNLINMCGWTFSMWFTLSLFIKEVLSFKQVFFFICFGWFILGMIIKLCLNFQKENSLTNLYILHSSCLKDVEMFNNNIYHLLKIDSENNKILLIGIVNSFKEFFCNDISLKEMYDNFSKNKFLIKKYYHQNIILFEIYSIIYTLLHSMLDKLKDDIVLILCAFLLNRLNNYNLAMYYCSKYKINGYYNNFMKFSLIEDSKQLIIKKFKESNLDQINKIEIGKVILYYKLINDLKLKIYDAACEQSNYFDIIRNNNITNNLVPDFIKNGNLILNIRNEILSIWEHIISLNPFNEEIKNDYTLYLKNIIQDIDLYEQEETKISNLKNIKAIQKEQFYYTLFDYEISSIILIDSYVIKGKIIYVTSNFIYLFNYISKDIINLNIKDLIPKCISNFHQELFEEGLKYSNLHKIFKKEKDLLLKGKNNELYNIKGFFKLLPDLSIGSIYIGLLQKFKDKDFLILLDKNLTIDSMTIPFYSYELNNNIYNRENYPFGLSKHIIGYNISIIIPCLLNLIKFDFENYVIEKINIDLKGTLYPIINDIYYFEKKINSFLESIKELSKEKYKFEKRYSSLAKNAQNSLKDNENKDYLDLINEYNTNNNHKSFHISYKITKHTFLNNKYIYYRVYINRDIFSEFEIKERNSLIQQQNITFMFETFNNEFKINDDNKRKKLLYDFNNLNNQNNENEDNKDIQFKKDNEKNQNEKIEKEHPLNKSKKLKNLNKSKYYIPYQDMKSKINNNEIPNFIIIMNIISLIFALLTMIFIILNNNLIKSKFEIIQDYLFQNMIFNKTKIILYSIYFSVSDLKLLKYNVIGNQTCVNENFCASDFKTLFNFEIKILKENSDQLIKLDKDFQILLGNDYKIEIYGNTFENFTTYNCKLNDILYLIFTFTQKIIPEFENYLFRNEQYIEVYIDSIIQYCIFYLNLNEINGLNISEKKKKLKNSRFKMPQYYFIINWILFLIFFGVLLRFVNKIYQSESNLIIRIVKFYCESFEKYIKYLDDLKKKLKNESNEENKNDEHLNENESEEDNNSHNLKTIKHEKKKVNNEEDNKKKKKIKMMKRYFFIHNIIFAVKIIIVSIIIISYYIIMYLLYEKKKKKFLEFDDFKSTLLEIIVSSFISFSKIKNQTIYFFSFIQEKKEKLNQINSGNSPITFNNEIYTQENYTLLENKKYYFEIPDEKEIEIKKFNNLLRPYSSNLDTSKNNNNLLLITLYNNNACEIIFHLFYYNETKYDICLNFWSSFITQGIEQSLIQLEIEISHIIDIFIDINKSNEVLSDLRIIEKSFSNCDDFILNYLLLSYRETQFILKNLEKGKLDNIYHSFKIVLFIFIFGCIPLFFSFLLFIRMYYVLFKDFINLIIIFPLEYLIEEENLYIEIHKLYKLMY